MGAPITPGPWKANVEKRPGPASGYWYVIESPEENGLGEFYGDDHEENAANARLAAAAPELYAALKAVTPLLEQERAVIFDSNVQLSGKYKGQVIDTVAKKEIAAMDAAIAKANAALAKARTQSVQP